MLDLKFVRENTDMVQAMLRDRHSDTDASEFTRLDEQRRKLLAEVESLKARRNAVNQEITALKKAGQDAGDLINQMKSVSAGFR